MVKNRVPRRALLSGNQWHVSSEFFPCGSVWGRRKDRFSYLEQGSLPKSHITPFPATVNCQSSVRQGWGLITLPPFVWLVFVFLRQGLIYPKLASNLPCSWGWFYAVLGINTGFLYMVAYCLGPETEDLTKVSVCHHRNTPWVAPHRAVLLTTKIPAVQFYQETQESDAVLKAC